MAKGSLAQGVNIPTATTELYQAPTQIAKTLIQKAQFVNSAGVSSITIDVWITPDAATPASEGYKVIDSKEIGINDTYIATELISEYVNSGGKIYAESSADGVYAWINGNTFKTET